MRTSHGFVQLEGRIPLPLPSYNWTRKETLLSQNCLNTAQIILNSEFIILNLVKLGDWKMCRKLSALLALIMALMVLVGSCAGAEPVAKIGGMLLFGSEFIGELPNGRMVFSADNVLESGMSRLQCLEPEGTVAWALSDYTRNYTPAVITEDGTIAIQKRIRLCFCLRKGKRPERKSRLQRTREYGMS